MSRQKLTNAELAERRSAVEFARVNNEFEGLYITDTHFIALTEKYANGEIELEAIGDYVDGL